jgi:hypothetical protein
VISRRILLPGLSLSFLLPSARPFAATERPAARAPAGEAARLPLVMLDPGHGGKDPGAIGISGTYEKHVALAAAQELRRLLLATKRYRVEMTRGRDAFVALEERVAIARRRQAALFVSLHAGWLAEAWAGLGRRRVEFWRRIVGRAMCTFTANGGICHRRWPTMLQIAYESASAAACKVVVVLCETVGLPLQLCCASSVVGGHLASLVEDHRMV